METFADMCESVINNKKKNCRPMLHSINDFEHNKNNDNI